MSQCSEFEERRVLPAKMFLSFLAVYLYLVICAVVSTIGTILLGLGWGPLAHLYISLIRFMQSFYPRIYPLVPTATWPAILRRCEKSALERHRNSSLSSFKFSTIPARNVLEVCTDALKAAIEAIAQDEISVAFHPAPTCYTTLLQRPDQQPFLEPTYQITKLQLAFYYFTVVIRWGFLFPTRFCILISSVIFCGLAAIGSNFTSYTRQQQAYIARVYSRLWCAGLGYIVAYHDREYRPQTPGLAVSNHLSPNDAQAITSDIDPYEQNAYTLTGQRHSGILQFLQSLGTRLCPCIWFDRYDANDRIRFFNSIIRYAKHDGPVLLFPEGYCTNNTNILQFRKALFEDGVTVYPIAIRQNARYGDSYWSEDHFAMYLLRLMVSWAIVYDVYYLPMMKKKDDEPAELFAERVQNAIAGKSSDHATPIAHFNSLAYKGVNSKVTGNK
ncbi:hypothetical protein AB6A40_004151 [Gnathostoma spinigerum]|uniref:Phospholipid/glycerol acyltransferase domain-containing protein n=1 Tax=Gnathostoma spinigerum TaxID=75299 RepID=A0ABD6EDU3_9BILA